MDFSNVASISGQDLSGTDAMINFTQSLAPSLFRTGRLNLQFFKNYLSKDRSVKCSGMDHTISPLASIAPMMPNFRLDNIPGGQQYQRFSILKSIRDSLLCSSSFLYLWTLRDRSNLTLDFNNLKFRRPSNISPSSWVSEAESQISPDILLREFILFVTFCFLLCPFSKARFLRSYLYWNPASYVLSAPFWPRLAN